MHNRELVSNAETKSSLSQHPEEGRQRIFEHPLLKLQRRYGNHFVQRVLALARKGDGETEVSPDIEQAIHQARSSGRALDSDVRTQMEPALGADFSGVRVHTNAQADKLNQALNARAFTTGQDIFFKQGEYRPGSSIGRELLAHELTHVVQQTGDAKCKLSIGQADDHYEQEADQIAHTVVRRERQSVSAYRGDHVCRQSDFREEEQGEEPYRAKLESPQVRQQKDSDEEDEKSVQAEAIGAGGQAVAHNQPINSLRAPDGRISLRIRRQLAPDQQTPDTGTVPGASPASMPEADRAAANIMDMYYRENILFDYWGGDCRDNNKNNRMDANDRAERNSADGAHYSGTYRGFRTLPGTCYGGEGGTVTTGDFEVDTPVKYRVCADVVSLAYSNAGLLSTTRHVHNLVTWFRTRWGYRFWQVGDPDFPTHYLPGDFICSYSPRERHGHAGMVVLASPTRGGTSRPLVVHLPGPSQHIFRGVYDPTRLTDLTMESWPSNRQIYGIGRYTGRSSRR